MHSMNRLVAALLLAFSSFGAFAEVPATAVGAAAAVPASAFNLEAGVLRSMKAFDVPGMAIAIVKDGKVIAAKGFGVRTLGQAAPVDGKTLFEIASNSRCCHPD